ncbi:MAG: glycosyl hydrolase [Sphaerochaeta sp.]|nr:glycosyl hydrolase [Sphaerochaeta sp.]
MDRDLIRYKLSIRGSKPYIRWWWFADAIKTEDIIYQLDWLKDNGFGGVEIAWVYPSKYGNSPEHYLSEGWIELVLFTYNECKKRQLTCDLTFGTLWPFGGSFVIPKFASKTWKGLSTQQVTRSWESAYSNTPRKVIDHLDRNALNFYASHILKGFKGIVDDQNENPGSSPSSFFCDSLEVDHKDLWTDSFDECFINEYGYSILPYMENLDQDPHRRFEYRQILSKLFLEEFFEPFMNICHENGMLSRVQAHGAPTDILKAFTLCDVPESEALLFDPEFSLIPASSSLLANKTVVSCEAFTCLYGWVPYPQRSPHMKSEKVEDLKLLADALFACGINHIIWHGMPFNGKDDSKEFYASVYVGNDGALSEHLVFFNHYMEVVSSIMQKGVPFSSLAIYLPSEDMLMLNKIPEEKMKPSSFYYWEMQDLRIPEPAEGYHPTWVSDSFLQDATCSNGKLVIGDAEFSGLYVDAAWLTLSSLKHIVAIAEQGVPVFVAKDPAEPGTVTHKRSYTEAVEKLNACSHPAEALHTTLSPFIRDIDKQILPLYRARSTASEVLCFIAHPEARGLTYPMEYGKGATTGKHRRIFEICLPESNKTIVCPLTFESCHSVLLRIDRQSGAWEQIALPLFRNGPDEMATI